MSELLQVFDEHGDKAGVEERDEVHKKGLWHQTFHCWLVELISGEPHLYFQLRAKDKKDFPATFDITAAGHIEAHEGVVEAGIREMEEELGFKVARQELSFQGCYRQQVITERMIDREFCHVYFYENTIKPVFQLTEEVDDVIRISCKEFAKVLNGKTIVVDSLIDGSSRSVSNNNLCPSGEGYFSFILDKLKLYYKGTCFDSYQG
ncbi:NUDIX hydrolase [Thalassobacillus pellis]|uniref:NUDIX hydrolase n=1 Tax=Thalassobacillus pellis TaxID=748008 RepID=UPI00196015C1|nr:NUDIX domain-containing protein [Thalassobacillus pellis]MBM7554243.1 isopentenyldiphosphate isomerase [Thalassobacillus pellis]